MNHYVVQPLGNLHANSPLDSLVRRTSSRRRPNALQPPLPSDAGEPSQYAASAADDASQRKPSGHPPPSPLLHTRFRASVATQSSTNTSADLYGQIHAMMGGSMGRDAPFEDDASIYSSATASWSAPRPQSHDPPDKPDYIPGSSGSSALSEYPQRGAHFGQESDWRNHDECHLPMTDVAASPTYQQPRPDHSTSVPTVVVSTEEPMGEVDDYYYGQGAVVPSPPQNSHNSVGRTPSALPTNLNFSRPVRSDRASEEAKRAVLARNAFRSNVSPRPSPQASPLASSQQSSFQAQQSAPPLTFEKSPNTSRSPSRSPSPGAPNPQPSSMLRAPSPSVPRFPNTANQHGPVPLLRDPPPVPSSPSSLYSAYSYYPMDSPSHSPTTDTLQVPPSPHAPPFRNPSPLTAAPGTKSPAEQPELADQYLQEGIQHHEANRLREAALAFEKSATTPGGSGVGMLMWGLTLRHGWGCPKNEKLGFSWLRRAAEAAVGDLERVRMGVDASAVRGELVLAIYEVGQCFLRGWGVKKDQKMAVSYFQVAAKLGDADAQQELAFCYANGRGCKKDRKEAAKWYRAAVAQGVSDVGLAWIYKEKFQ